MELGAIVNSLPTLTWAFIVTIAILGIYLSVINYSPAAVVYGPGILVSIGIFGTFLGIAIGLAHFDTADIQGSIPGLLDGLKTSFWSSIAGLGTALMIKLRQLAQSVRSPKDGAVATGATVDDLVNVLNEVKHSLTGDDEGTVTGQIKLTRADMNDRIDSLKKSLNQFMEEMAASSAEKLVEALEAVIRDFNTKINEQFGDNFKQLNHAVGQILRWQDTYRSQMQEMILQQKQTANSMSAASNSYTKLVDSSKAFSETAEGLKTLVTTLHAEAERIEKLSTSLAKVLSECKTAIPDMEKKVLELASTLDKSVKDTNQTAIRTITAANNELNQHLKLTAEKTQKQVQTLEKALESELTKSLEMFGRQLAALSEKFVSDYTPLTQKLSAVVRIAQGVSR